MTIWRINLKMKKSDIFLGFVLALTISFSFLSIQTQTNKAIGQTSTSSSSSSSSSSGSTSSSSGSSTTSSSGGSTSSSSGEITSSSSSGNSASSSGSSTSSTSSSGFSCIPMFTNCSCSTICGPDTPDFIVGACFNPSCTGTLDPTVTCGKVNNECIVTSSGASSSSTSSSSGTSATINPNFTGLWKAELPKPKLSSSSSGSIQAQTAPSSSSGTPAKPKNEGQKGSRIITFKLCVKDGDLEGTVQQGGILNMGVITSQTIISPDEISINVEGEKGAKATINLKLVNEREFTGTFTDGRTFKARKLNSFKSCLAPGHNKGEDNGPGMIGDPAMGAMGGMDFGPSASSSGGDISPPPMGAMGGMDFDPSASSSGGDDDISPPPMGAMSGMDFGPSMDDMPPVMGGPSMGDLPPVMGGMGDSSGGSSSGSSDDDGPLEGPDEEP